MARKLEVVTNAAILVVSCLIGWVVVDRYLLKTSSRPTIEPGDSISLPDTDWTRNGRTLVLVLQDGCKFCSESAPFYRKLVALEAKAANVHLMAILPQSRDDGARYLDRIGVSIADVRLMRLREIRIRGTPTLLLVGHRGVVEKIWVGRLSGEREADLLKSVVGSID